MEAMIFAAGLGTRLQNETANQPKALVNVGGKTLLQCAVEKITNAGATRIVINVHHFSELVMDFVNSHSWDIPVLISDESDLLLETGGGLKKAAPHFSGKDPILLYNVDILSNFDLRSFSENHVQSEALATLAVRERKTQRYFKFDRNMQLVGWVNKKSGERKVSRPENFENARELAFSGIHFVHPGIFKFMPPEERFSIVELYLELAKTQTIKGVPDQSDLWMDVGKPSELEAARKRFRV